MIGAFNQNHVVQILVTLPHGLHSLHSYLTPMQAALCEIPHPSVTAVYWRMKEKILSVRLLKRVKITVHSQVVPSKSPMTKKPLFASMK